MAVHKGTDDGLLKCYEHDVSFDTPSEFHQHRTEMKHSYSGSTRCQDCKDKNIEFDPEEMQTPQDPNHHGSTICPDCLDKLAEKLEKHKKSKENKQ